jgi:hypothetical protein
MKHIQTCARLYRVVDVVILHKEPDYFQMPTERCVE